MRVLGVLGSGLSRNIVSYKRSLCVFLNSNSQPLLRHFFTILRAPRTDKPNLLPLSIPIRVNLNSVFSNDKVGVFKCGQVYRSRFAGCNLGMLSAVRLTIVGHGSAGDKSAILQSSSMNGIPRTLALAAKNESQPNSPIWKGGNCVSSNMRRVKK